MFDYDKWNTHVRAMLDHARSLEAMAANANDEQRLALLRMTWAVRDRLSDAKLENSFQGRIQQEARATE